MLIDIKLMIWGRNAPHGVDGRRWCSTPAYSTNNKFTDMEQIQDIDIKRLEVNKGQVEGLPKNPRFIRDERYKALVKSI